jgi:hypothetical protein
LADELLWRAARARDEKHPLEHELLGELADLPRSVVERQGETTLLAYLESMWSSGWQPAELLRQSRLRGTRSATSRLVLTLMAVDHVRQDRSRIDPRWIRQLERLDPPPVKPGPGFVRRWSATEEVASAELIDVLVDAIMVLGGLPRIEQLMPSPGQYEPGAPSFSSQPDGADIDPVLAKVRGLLAKAESTTFEAEALAFTAKAQELMTRHAIDVAMLTTQARNADAAPIALRLPLEPPYADAKSLLLQVVAQSGRCRSVFHSSTLMSTVIGFPGDLASVDMLFTSLLVQAQAAMAQAAAKAPPGTRVRSQRYRSAFLVAFAQRIGDRLAEINEAVYASVESDRGSDFLPVLRSLESAVEDAMNERFSGAVSSRVRGGYDAAGWAGGRLAAENAQLNEAVTNQ